MKNQIKDMLNAVKQMSQAEQAALVEEIMNLMSGSANKKTGACYELVEIDSVPDCPRCGAKSSHFDIVIDGRMKNGAQRYLCKKCGRHFQATTGTTFAWSKKDASTWRKYVELTLNGASLHKCKDECGISYSCSFEWRHKILHVFEDALKDTNMSGIVEVDEMLIPLSYKGNHV